MLANLAVFASEAAGGDRLVEMHESNRPLSIAACSIILPRHPPLLTPCQRLMPATSIPPLSFATSLAPPTAIPVLLRGNNAEIIVLAPAVRQGRSDHLSTRPARFDINAYS